MEIIIKPDPQDDLTSASKFKFLAEIIINAMKSHNINIVKGQSVLEPDPNKPREWKNISLTFDIDQWGMDFEKLNYSS